MEKRLGTFGLSLIVVGVLLAGCQQQATPAPGAAVPSTDSPQQPVSGAPVATPPADTMSEPPADRGVVEGRVRTPTGAPVVAASIQVRSLDTPPVPVPELAVTTDEGGYFRWLLAPGRYELTAVPLDGTPPATSQAIDVRAGTTEEIVITVD